nr:hypothetical protein IMFVHALQ_IMFVHALQ_CDS_0005 [Microvirus sp.]
MTVIRHLQHYYNTTRKTVSSVLRDFLFFLSFIFFSRVFLYAHRVRGVSERIQDQGV